MSFLTELFLLVDDFFYNYTVPNGTFVLIICALYISLIRVSASATSVRYFFPSSDSSFSCPNFSDNWLNPSVNNFFFKSLQYFLGRLLSVNTSIISITEKYHFCSSSFLRRSPLDRQNGFSCFLPKASHRDK